MQTINVFETVSEEISIIEKLLLLHSQNPHLWHSLGDAFHSFPHSMLSVDVVPTSRCSDLKVSTEGTLAESGQSSDLNVTKTMDSVQISVSSRLDDSIVDATLDDGTHLVNNKLSQIDVNELTSIGLQLNGLSVKNSTLVKFSADVIDGDGFVSHQAELSSDHCHPVDPGTIQKLIVATCYLASK